MREIRHRVQSCQTVACILPLVSRGARAVPDSLHANVIANVGADRPTEEIARRRNRSAIVVSSSSRRAAATSPRERDSYAGTISRIEGRRWRP